MILRSNDCDFVGLFVEINVRKKKWLFYFSYNPYKSNIANHLKNICKAVTNLEGIYGNLIQHGDFDVEHEEESIAEFLNLYDLKNLAKQNTCFKNLDKSTCTHLLLTNYPRSFQNTDTLKQDCQIYTS